MSDAEFVELRVNGERYKGWKSAEVTRSIEEISGSFSLNVTDVWAVGSQPWPIREGDACDMLVAGRSYVSGYVDSRAIEYSATQHSITISGRDKSAALVDCSVDIGKWQFKRVPMLVFLNQLGAQFGVQFTLGPGATLPVVPEEVISIDPGDTAFAVVDRLCKFAGVLPVSDGAGGVVLTRPGIIPSTGALMEGANILSGSATYDHSERFRRYVVLGTGSGSGGGSVRVRGEAEDMGVIREDRVLVLQSETATTHAGATSRAQWEASVRAAKSDRISVQLAGLFCNELSDHWAPGTSVQIWAPSLGAEGTMVISRVQQSIGQSTKTTLELLRPDAFALDLDVVGKWKK